MWKKLGRLLLPTTWAAWVFDHIPLGVLAPWVFGFIIGRWPRKGKRNNG